MRADWLLSYLIFLRQLTRDYATGVNVCGVPKILSTTWNLLEERQEIKKQLIHLINNLTHKLYQQHLKKKERRMLKAAVFIIAVFSSAADQVSSLTHSDPRFAGLRLPQTPPILNTDVYYLQLVSLYTGTHAETHAHKHIHKCPPLHVQSCFAWLCCTTVCVCVCDWDKNNGWACNEIFKEEQHIACKVLEVTSPGERGGEKKDETLNMLTTVIHFLSFPAVVSCFS